MLPIEAALSAKTPHNRQSLRVTGTRRHWPPQHATYRSCPLCTAPAHQVTRVWRHPPPQHAAYRSHPLFKNPCTPGQLHVAIRASLACCLPQSPSLQSPSTWDMFVSDLFESKTGSAAQPRLVFQESDTGMALKAHSGEVCCSIQTSLQAKSTE